MKVGIGYDIHAFEDGKALKLGGVTIPFPQGLKGHSDGDCLIHAICDALLGAACLGDIGEHYPDTDPSIKNIDSSIILIDILKKVKNKGYQIDNIDANIIAQVPKLTPYKNAIKLKLAEIIGIDPSQINIKAKTKENLDAVGRKLAIECQAIVLLK